MRHILITTAVLLIAAPPPADAGFVPMPGAFGEVAVVGGATIDAPLYGLAHIEGLVAADTIASGNRAAALASARQVPEPRSLLLLGLGLIAIGFARRRK